VSPCSARFALWLAVLEQFRGCKRICKDGGVGIDSSCYEHPTVRQQNGRCLSRALAISLVGIKLPLAASNNSAVARRSVPLPPGAIRTFPSLSRVVVCDSRGVFMPPVEVNVPLVGSKSSAEPRALPSASRPPITSTMAAIGSLENHELMPQGKNLGMQRCAGPKPSTN
jgi:hypothetical protein